jgi:hypothetical protein
MKSPIKMLCGAMLSVLLFAQLCKAQPTEFKGSQTRFDEVVEVIRSGNAYQRAETVPALAQIDGMTMRGFAFTPPSSWTASPTSAPPERW